MCNWPMIVCVQGSPKPATAVGGGVQDVAVLWCRSATRFSCKWSRFLPESASHRIREVLGGVT